MMFRSHSPARLLSVLALAAAGLLAVGTSAAGETPAPASPQTKAAAVTTALDGINGRLDRLEADIPRAEHIVASPPEILLHELKVLRWRVQDQTRRLVGLHWTVADPVLREADRLDSRIKDLEGRLENWQPSQPPDPNRPLKTSASNGTGAITGSLTDEVTGNPIPYTRVEVYCPSQGFDAETFTGADGSYTMGGLGTGDCWVRTWNELDYIDEIYDDFICDGFFCDFTDGTPVPVVDSETTTGIDFALGREGAISGILTDARDDSPLASAQVRVYNAGGGTAGSATTDDQGIYSVPNLRPGTYYVKGWSYPDFVGELYDDIPCPDYCDPTTGTPVAVTSGQITTGIDFALTPTGSITGTVTISSSAAPLSQLQVAAYDLTGALVAEGTIDSGNNTYEIIGLPAGTYFVTATGGPYVGELYDNIPCLDACDPTTGTPIQVNAGAATPNIDFILDPLPTISGNVLDSVSGAPLESASVYFCDSQGYYWGIAHTDSNGAFTFGVSEAGTFFAGVVSEGHIPEVYQEIQCPYSCQLTDGTPITVNLGTDVTGIDFTPDPESMISGTVTSQSGDPITQIEVSAYDATGTRRGHAVSDSLGQFQIGGLPADSFYAMAEDTFSPYDWVKQIYNGIDCLESCDPTTGTPITTTVGGVSGISFSLTHLGWITGHVTETGSGASVQNAGLNLFDSGGNLFGYVLTGADGMYRFDALPTGTYYLLTTHAVLYDELYDNIPCEGGCDVSQGTPIEVALGSEITIDVSLNRAGSVSGKVTDALFGPPVQTQITVYDAQGAQVSTTTTDASTGEYSVTGLPDGTYFVATTGAPGHIDELYDDIPCDGGCDVTGGTPLVVAFGSPIPGIDFALEPDPTFLDVPVGYWARYWIERLYAAGITAGCGAGPTYCPEAAVARSQMAVFLLKSKEGRYYTPPPAVGIFDDVPAGNGFAPWVEELAARGITSGCNADPPLFCPNASLTRNQMAKFLLRTLEGPLYSPPAATGVFDDVPVDDPFAPWIEDLAARGITSGCSADPPLFCPDNPVSRAQMAVFLVKTFGL
ncbi:MAG: carboxypeptidase regulatory-like domain-containing protein [Acidobacteria bacterium]|nr:carboxypeptidase regulatory-like domain-containing protein [Acidobacteriota bacterium]